MAEHNHALHQLKEHNKLLEAELHTIKSSRSYKLARTAAVFKNKLREDPKGTLKKAVSLLLRKPAKLLRLAKGGSGPSAIQDVVQNRVAQYHAWIVLNEPTEEELAGQRLAVQKLTKKPLISIITPVFNPPVDVLEELIESVLAQTYPYFELCIGNVGKDEAVKELLAKYAAEDNRIKVYSFDTNLGIGGDSNRVLEKVKGDFIALLDHDDTLSPDALYENAKLINEQDPDFIYSDKDMIDEKGVRYEPLFKPEWSPEIMLSANYLTHLNVMRTRIVREVGGWDGETNGAQDWDLFLKVVHASKTICHIPKILYHWRVIATSTAHSIDTKPYALAGQRRAVQKYLDQEGIAATPYHRKTELLLQWKDEALDQKPLGVIHGHDLASTLRMLGRLRSALPQNNRLCVVYQGAPSQNDLKLLQKQGADKVFAYQPGALGKTLNTLLDAFPTARTMFFADARLKLPGKWRYSDMAGWLSVRGVAMVGGKVVGRDELIQDCGGLLTLDGPVNLFRGYPAYYQGYIGNVEWIRNLRVVSRQLFVANTDVLRRVRFDSKLADDAVIAGAMIQVSGESRLVFCPKAAVYSRTDIGELPKKALSKLSATLLDRTLKQSVDSYSNPNVLAHDPMRLNITQPDETSSVGPALDTYQRDALVLSRLYDLSAEDIAYNRDLAKKPMSLQEPKTVGWFLPGFDSIYAGLNNIFSFAEYMAGQGLTVHFYIMRGEQGVAQERALVTRQYPGLKHAAFVAIDSNTPKIQPLDIGICTQWASAYPLAKLRNVRRKCYFIQDCEFNFYPQGSVSALVELTYRLGFYGIANTQGLLDMYKHRFGGRGVLLKSVVDMKKWHPREDRHYTPTKPYKVFFYARPNMPRNAFELGLAGLLKLKEQLGSDVQIMTAGANWDDEALGVRGQIINLQQIPYDEVPAYYRSLDAGLMFMFSGHPGVTASELMASGVPVVVNEYDDTTWHELYENGNTCLVTLPTASEIAHNLRRCLEDQDLRKKLIEGGIKKAGSFYKGYPASQKTAFKAILKG